MDMSIPYEATGRRQQKARTKQALVRATHTLLGEGITPTVEQAAAAAAVARTTAYRYFPNQRALLVAAHPEIEMRSLLPDDAPTDPEKRLDVVIDSFVRQNVQTEPQLRAMLRLSLDTDPSLRGQLPLRKGRAIGWIEDALAPLQETMSEAEVHRLALAIRSATGIEALVWLTDVAGLSREEAMRTMRWSARALLRSALVDGPPFSRGNATGNRPHASRRRHVRHSSR
jgi:AcrR family transcriptional regulator